MTVPEVMTRPQALAAGLKHYYTGKPCKRGHVGAFRFTSSAQCQKCAAELVFERRRNNPEAHRQYARRYSAENPGKIRNWNRSSYLRNRDKRLQYERSKGPRKQQQWLMWARKNKELICHKSAVRRAAAKKATPAWFDADEVLDLYRKAAEMTEKTGVKHEVDHIVPLQSDLVCGLHWHGNMRVITKSENASKRNLHWPGKPDLVGAGV